RGVRLHRRQDGLRVRGRRHDPAPDHAADLSRRVRVPRAREGVLAAGGLHVRGGEGEGGRGDGPDGGRGTSLSPRHQELAISVVKVLVLFAVLLGVFSGMTYIERRLLAFMQFRLGPNRTGPLGLLQPVADGIKLFFKEEVTPAGANRWLFVAAPAISLI